MVSIAVAAALGILLLRMNTKKKLYFSLNRESRFWFRLLYAAPSKPYRHTFDCEADPSDYR